MFWQNRSILLLLITALSAQALYRDPFVPLYMQNPLGEYERILKIRAQDGRSSGLHPEMYLCRTNTTPDVEPFVVFDGKTYRVNDEYNHGTIQAIDCDFVTIVSGHTQLKIALYDQVMIQKVPTEKINVSRQ